MSLLLKVNWGRVVAIIAVIGAAYALDGKNLLRNIFRRIPNRSVKRREALRFVPKPNEVWWRMGSKNNKPAMEVEYRFHVTNRTSKTIFLLRTFIAEPKTEGFVAIRRPKEKAYGRFPIMPNSTAEGSAEYFIDGAVRKEGEEFNATLIFVDKNGNEYKVKNIVFKYS